jgi:hypothetical protein
MTDDKKKLTTAAGAPVVDNQNTMNPGERASLPLPQLPPRRADARSVSTRPELPPR